VIRSGRRPLVTARFAPRVSGDNRRLKVISQRSVSGGWRWGKSEPLWEFGYFPADGILQYAESTGPMPALECGRWRMRMSGPYRPDFESEFTVTSRWHYVTVRCPGKR
jgi:hypothetical protein